MKKWRIVALIPFPLEQMAPPLPNGGMPQMLEWASRLISVRHTTHEYDISIQQVKRDDWVPHHQGQIVEPVELQIMVHAQSANSALESVDLLLESICDDFAFRLQMAIPIKQLEVIDVSEPVAVADEREFLYFPEPGGYTHPKFKSTVFVDGIVTELTPLLRTDFSTLDKRMQATMRWFHKSIAATSDVDRFIFLMICLEILCEDYSEKVMAPFKARCGHEIPNCPTCESPLERVVNGATLKKFLVEVLGMDERTAKETWQIRQVVHGSNDLSPKKMSDVPRVAQALRSCIVSRINQKLERDPRHGPFVAPDGPGITMEISLLGRREITEGDLRLADVPS